MKAEEPCCRICFTTDALLLVFAKVDHSDVYSCSPCEKRRDRGCCLCGAPLQRHFSVGPSHDGQGGWEKSQDGSRILRFYCHPCAILVFCPLPLREAEAVGQEVVAEDDDDDEDDEDEEEGRAMI